MNPSRPSNIGSKNSFCMRYGLMRMKKTSVSSLLGIVLSLRQSLWLARRLFGSGLGRMIDDEDERVANDEPSDLKNRQLKQIFEKAAGQTYIHFAYEPAYRLARRLLRFAIFGARSNEDLKEPEEMFAKWERIRHRRGIQGASSELSELAQVDSGEMGTERIVTA
ncbi:hypothetical protein Z517_01253 [Fonsecaea pedrosoi CBS 271.37]|uniref:Uncharacterized protein n=1 Tax=Fonsecaea pedrosoi CBS 271.37 TaxID=1442368 RepID=A0A0D2H4Q3_9EURO|nr:uncharacterized protein Z517_01253 [Fonsecaea pedrosoi CBS 271.37]KIW85860.1 hypothetical protein Z517_01253 [Fonsecaea pedrosoi CBS 271.37]